MRMARAVTLALATLVVGALVPAVAAAQRPTARRQQTIEIRGQVPTPQVVTVRPREVPMYSRQVLVPNFYDHDFWPSILPAYQLVPQRMITGRVAGDTTAMRRDTTGTRGAAPTGAPSGTSPANTSGRPPARR